MKTLGWPPNFVARCPVKLFEASGGSSTWQSSGTVGEFHMRPLGNAMLHFQLRDLLDNQILFEYTMRKPEAFIVAAQRFFVIRLENGSFRGFGFSDNAAACEMKDCVQKAVKPFSIQESVGEAVSRAFDPQASTPAPASRASGSSNKKASDIVLYESVPRRSTARGSGHLHKKEQRSPAVPSVATFSSAPDSNLLRSNWKFFLKGLATLSQLKKLGAISQIFGWKEHEMEIGYPTDVKHVAHIGWDGPSVSGPSWMDELKPGPDFSSGPLREFGQPRGPDWIHDALSAAKWTAQGLGENFGLPPAPPTEFQDLQASHTGSKQKDSSSKRKSKISFSRSHVYQT